MGLAEWDLLEEGCASVDASRVILLDLRAGAARLLPEGRLLPEAVWQRPHRSIVRLCLTAAGLLVLFAWLRGDGQPAAVAVLGAVAGPVALASISAGRVRPRPRR
jgi:hypothetical protein